MKQEHSLWNEISQTFYWSSEETALKKFKPLFDHNTIVRYVTGWGFPEYFERLHVCCRAVVFSFLDNNYCNDKFDWTFQFLEPSLVALKRWSEQSTFQWVINLFTVYGVWGLATKYREILNKLVRNLVSIQFRKVSFISKTFDNMSVVAEINLFSMWNIEKQGVYVRYVFLKHS